MEDENGLELSLGLPWCRSSAESKDKNDNSSDSKTDEGDRSNKLINDFKNFLEGGTRKQESGNTSQRSDPVNPDATDVDASKSLNSRGLWPVSDNRGAEAEEEKRSEAGNKRKNLFDEISNQKKRESEKIKSSHISIATDDGSTAEYEDVADSEVEGSTSRLVSHHDDATKKYMGGAGPSEVPKEVHSVIDSSVVDLQGQKRFTISPEKEFKVGNVPYGVPFQTQSVNIMNVPFPLPVESNSIGVPNTSGYPLHSMIQVMASTNSERPGSQSVVPGNLPVMFGYPSVQLPVLDKDNFQGLATHPQQLHPSFVGRVLPNSDKQNDALKIPQAVGPVILPKPPEASQYTGRALEQAKGDGKQHLANGGSSAPTEDGSRGGTAIFGTKDDSEKSRAEGFPSESSAIRPGIAADLKFGGSGSYPNLPWVSTKGPGPNGKTISGVTYRYSTTQIKIVCACHGHHLSPEEFVRHASEEPSTHESNNPTTSAAS